MFWLKNKIVWVCTLTSCADPGIFVSGGPGQTAWTTFFLVLNLFYSLQRGSSGFIQRTLYFSKDSDRGQHFPVRGSPTFPGGPNANFYRNPYKF